MLSKHKLYFIMNGLTAFFILAGLLTMAFTNDATIGYVSFVTGLCFSLIPPLIALMVNKAN